MEERTWAQWGKTHGIKNISLNYAANHAVTAQLKEEEGELVISLPLFPHSSSSHGLIYIAFVLESSLDVSVLVVELNCNMDDLSTESWELVILHFVEDAGLMCTVSPLSPVF